MYSFLLLTTACVTARPIRKPPVAKIAIRPSLRLARSPTTRQAPAPAIARPAPQLLLRYAPRFAAPADDDTAPPEYRAQFPDRTPANRSAGRARPETARVTAYRPDFTLPEKHQDKVGHEQDYTWITGHLFYVRTDGGRWVLRYGQPDEVDKYGGSVVWRRPWRCGTSAKGIWFVSPARWWRMVELHPRWAAPCIG